jgi:putative ABC transport system permease protein
MAATALDVFRLTNDGIAATGAAMIEDVRYALRQLRKNPGFAVTGVITLGLGIGAAAAMFGLIQGVLLSPPPYADPSRLVLVSPSRIDGQPYTQGTTIGQWIDWRSSSRTLEAPALYRWTFNFLVLPDGSESLGGMVVTGNFFDALGLTPVAGREFTPAEAGRPKVPPTAIILGYELWQRKFNGDPAIVGTTVRISRFPAPLPVVGVMPPGVRFLPDPGNASEPNYDVNAHVDFWLSVAPDETQLRARGWNAVARLRDGATVNQAQAELSGLAVRQAQADPNLVGLTASVRPLPDVLNDEARALLLPLFGSVALVFFVACVNVAGLFVARGLQRHREYAMRAALGASRARLFRQLLTESAALSMVSAIAGAAIAAATVNLFKAIGGHAVPRADAVTVGWPVFAFGCVAALLAAVLAGVLPALRAASPRHSEGLKGTRSSAGRGERRLLGAIATVQIVFTVALLAGAALLVRTAQNLARVRPGYDIENILAVTVTTVTPNTWKEFHTRVLERVAAIPGVRQAAFVWGLPLTGNKWMGTLELVEHAGSGRLADQLSLPLRSVTPEYFGVMNIQLVDGRPFTSSDSADSPRVAIVNQTLASRYFPGVNAIGRQMRFAGDPKRPLEIVGVVSDIRTEGLSEQAGPQVYLPFWQSGAFSKHLVLRAASDAAALTPLVRREIRAVDSTAAVEHATTMAQIRRESLAPRTFTMRLLIGFAVVATSLALVGIYGVLSLSVGSRVKEIAVRKAVGAQHHDIIRMILSEGGRLIAIGVALGIVLAVVFGRALEAHLFQVRSADPISLATAAAIFGAVAVGACLVPALRAARTDLLEALHQE